MNGWLLATAGGWTNAMNAECLVNIGVRIIIVLYYCITLLYRGVGDYNSGRVIE